jgi:polyhydroxyalkanoate synthase subunit PhaC
MRPPPRVPAPHRVGEPSPLVFHLAAALSAYQHALFAAPNAADPRFPWSQHLRPSVPERPPERIALAREIASRLLATIEGLEIWQSHPYRRRLVDPPAIWTAGAARLLDFGQAPEATAPGGPPILVVPSLINRAYVLDLLPERSLLRWLAGRGLRPVLLDWGPPGPEERAFSLADYGHERLLPALRHLREAAGRPVAVVGYCMGGTLAAGLAARVDTGIAALATIGAPWDFAATAGLAGGLRAMVRHQGVDHVEAMLATQAEAFGAIPVTVFQSLFALVNPMQATLKFQKLARLDPASAAARHFVALEDWLADGVPMAGPAARDLLVDWQIGNTTARRAWRFLDGRVRPEAIAVPMLAFCGQADSIAPTPIALPLPRAVPGARVLAPPTGHVGMIVGSAAPAQVWRPLADFLAAHTG